MTSINITAQDNGVGLTRDVRLLSAALTQLGCDVAVTVIDRLERRRRRSLVRQYGVRASHWWSRDARLKLPRRFDLNVMLENVWPERLDLARVNVLVPNHEWFDKHDGRLIPLVDHVWAKTEMAHGLFTAMGKPTTYIGFDSEDRFDSSVPREPTFFHLAGKSPTKGTDRVLAAWSRHPEWPMLTVVRSRAANSIAPGAPNISLRQEYIADQELQRLYNANSFHLCPSETEGWGHYIVEGLGVGATVLTLDAAPMNELVTSDRGVLVPAIKLGHRRLATTYSFEESALAAAIDHVLHADRRAMSEAARAWFLANKQGFAARVERAINAAHRAVPSHASPGPKR